MPLPVSVRALQVCTNFAIISPVKPTAPLNYLASGREQVHHASCISFGSGLDIEVRTTTYGILEFSINTICSLPSYLPSSSALGKAHYALRFPKPLRKTAYCTKLASVPCSRIEGSMAQNGVSPSWKWTLPP